MNATDDWFEITELAPGVWQLVEGGDYGVQLVTGADRALLIDAGAGIGDLRGMTEQLTDLPVTVLLTHGHWDHAGHGHQFDDVRAHPAAHDDGVIQIEAFLTGPEDWAADWEAAGNAFPDGFDPDDIDIPPATGVRSIDPGATIDLGGREIEVIAAPGHAPGHVAALDREAGVLYGGDLVHMDHNLLIHFEGCDAAAYYETMQRLTDLRDEGAFDMVVLSHVPPMHGEDLDLLDAYRDALGEILAGGREYEEIDDGGTPARRYPVGDHEILTKRDVA